jgi:uncharacterized protein YecT (DUF1311 family)
MQLRKYIVLLLLFPAFAIAGACNFDSSQAQMTRCAIQEYSTAHDLLERNVGRVEHCLKVELAVKHEIWKKSERVRCEKEIEPGGSIYTQLIYMCLLEGTNKRIVDIRSKAPTCFK